jgi:hypothetical protein
MRLAEHVARMGENANSVLVEKPERIRPLETPRSRREDNINMILK